VAHPRQAAPTTRRGADGTDEATRRQRARQRRFKGPLLKAPGRERPRARSRRPQRHDHDEVAVERCSKTVAGHTSRQLLARVLLLGQSRTATACGHPRVGCSRPTRLALGLVLGADAQPRSCAPSAQQPFAATHDLLGVTRRGSASGSLPATSNGEEDAKNAVDHGAHTRAGWRARNSSSATARRLDALLCAPVRRTARIHACP
jgi:hypothetical protein